MADFIEEKELRILILEDVPSDAELEESELRDAGLVFTSLRVDTHEAFEQALDEFKPDVILLDYRLPAYSGRDALEYTRRTHPQIPVVMATGALGDEAAVELLKLGAKDYVLKDRLARLAPAVKRALSEEKGIRNRKLAEGKYKAVFNEAMDGIVLIDCSTWQVVECNPEFEKQTGRSLAQLTEIKMWEVLIPEQHEMGRQNLLDIQSRGSGRGSDFKIRKPGGEVVPFEFSAKFLSIQRQNFIQVVTRDISERLRAEQALLDSEARYKRITEGITDYQYTVRVEHGRAVETTQSQACMTVTGYSAAEFAANPDLWIQMVVPEDRELVLERVRQVLAGMDVPPIEHRIIRKDGELRWMSDTIIVFKDAAGTLLSYDGVIRDITERKRAENALRRANRALQTLSGGNLALVRSTSEFELLREVTKVIAEKGGYRLATVDYANDDADRSIAPVAWSGMEEIQYWAERLTWADNERGQLPVARGIRSGTTQLSRDIANNPSFAPWKETAHARGYVSNIALPLSDGNKTFGCLSIYSSDAEAFDEEEIRLLEEMANDLAYGIVTLRARSEHEKHAAILRQSLEQSIQTIAATVEARDPYTAGHQRRVGELAAAIAREMGLPEEQVNGVHLAAIIHDVGKIHIPAEILSKPGRLNDIEYLLIKTHPQSGYDILKDVKFPWPIADIILQHHERQDGSGYPHGLKGDQILLESRILAVADVVEAMSSHRPYRPTLGTVAALSEIGRGRGSAYEPAVVDACSRLFVDKGFRFGE
jgi:PAS domain S-box-containing protein/putative nucleotidyltransferase with HDIG domain